MTRALLGVVCVLLAVPPQAPVRTARPTFADYPVADIFRGTPAPVSMATAEARRFRTQLRQQAATGANFAGHYRLAVWGCGSTCTVGAIVDSRTGEVWFPGIQSYETGGDGRVVLTHGASFQLDSDLLILDGYINEKYKGRAFYRWHNNRLTLLRVDEYTDQQLVLNGEIMRAMMKWQSKTPEAYEFTLTLSGSFPTMITPPTFRVRDQRSTSLRPIDRSPEIYDKYDSIDMLIGLLFDEAADVPISMTATFDSTWGYPASGEIVRASLPGDRIAFRITGFTPIAK